MRCVTTQVVDDDRSNINRGLNRWTSQLRDDQALFDGKQIIFNMMNALGKVNESIEGRKI